MDEAKPMMEEEAEAVLRALGLPALEWTPDPIKASANQVKHLLSVQKKTQPNPSGSPDRSIVTWLLDRRDIVEMASVQNGYYSVRARRRLLVFPVYTACLLSTAPQGSGQHPQEFKSLSAAKRTCERHYAMGKWE